MGGPPTVQSMEIDSKHLDMVQKKAKQSWLKIVELSSTHGLGGETKLCAGLSPALMLPMVRGGRLVWAFSHQSAQSP